MNRLRGVVLLIAGCVALYAGFKAHTGSRALWAYGLAVIAFALGIWRLTHRSGRPRA